MRFTEILFDTLLEEVKNKKLFNTLMDIWKTERPNITDEEGERLFYDFAKIKEGLRPDRPQVFTFLSRYDGEHGYPKFDPNNLRQIEKYSYSQLSFLLNEFRPEERAVERDVFAGSDTKASPERITNVHTIWILVSHNVQKSIR